VPGRVSALRHETPAVARCGIKRKVQTASLFRTREGSQSDGTSRVGDGARGVSCGSGRKGARLHAGLDGRRIETEFHCTIIKVANRQSERADPIHV
jgi:hypothetical protein